MVKIMLKKDLVKTPNLKKVFTIINQHIYAKLKYVDTDTRARSKEMINLLLIKLVDEINKSPDEELDFYLRENETDQELLVRLQILFRKNVQNKYSDIISVIDFFYFGNFTKKSNIMRIKQV